MVVTDCDVNSVLSKWMLSPRKHTRRIHLYANTLDGFTCRVVTQYANTTLCRILHGKKPLEHLPKKANIIYDVPMKSDNDDDMAYIIATAIDEALRDVPRNIYRDITISILVTGIPNFNANNMYARYTDSSFKVQFIVLDSAASSADMLKPFYAIDESRKKRNCSFQYTVRDHSVAWQLCQALNMSAVGYLPHVKGKDIKLDTITTDAAERASELVSLVDTIDHAISYDWSGLDGKDYKDIDLAAKIQMTYEYFNNFAEWDCLQEWVSFMLQYLNRYTGQVYRDILELIAKKTWSDFCREYAAFADTIDYSSRNKGMIDLLQSRLKNLKQCGWNILTFEMSNDSRVLNGFDINLFAISFLQQNTVADVLVEYTPGNAFITIWSIKDNIDCGAVAADLGGHGMRRVAYIPYEADIDT